MCNPKEVIEAFLAQSVPGPSTAVKCLIYVMSAHPKFVWKQVQNSGLQNSGPEAPPAKKAKLTLDKQLAITKPIDLSNVNRKYLECFAKHFCKWSDIFDELPTQLHEDYPPDKYEQEREKAIPEDLRSKDPKELTEEDTARKKKALEEFDRKVHKIGSDSNAPPRSTVKNHLGSLLPVDALQLSFPAQQAMKQRSAKSGRRVCPCRFEGTGTSLCRRASFARDLDALQAIAAMMGADFKGHLECVDETTEERTLLHQAADDLQWEMVEWLVAQGADVNARDSHGYTVLHVAICRHAPANVIDKLLETSDIQAAAKDGSTALHFAWQVYKARHAHAADLVSKILEKGVDADARNTQHGKAISIPSEGFVTCGNEEQLERTVDAYTKTAERTTLVYKDKGKWKETKCSAHGSDTPLQLLAKWHFKSEDTRRRLQEVLKRLVNVQRGGEPSKASASAPSVDQPAVLDEHQPIPEAVAVAVAVAVPIDEGPAGQVPPAGSASANGTASSGAAGVASPASSSRSVSASSAATPSTCGASSSEDDSAQASLAEGLVDGLATPDDLYAFLDFFN